MGKTILSNSIAKIGQPISEENDKRRKIAFRDIAGCLERCYREFLKYNIMQNSESGKNAQESFKNAEKMVNLINEMKDELNNELLRIACFGEVDGREGVRDAIFSEINEVITKYSESDTEYPTNDQAKINVVKDFEEMNQTLITKKMNHIRRYPSLDDEERAKIVPLVQPPKQVAGPRRDVLAPWQVRVMNGEDDGFFREAEHDGRVLNLDKFRKNRNDEGR